jgi:hypothetical protein
MQSKQDLPKLQKFEIKCGCEGFDVRNSISRFKMYFELKIREACRV